MRPVIRFDMNLIGTHRADRDASSCDSLLAVRTPLLAINATDDPVRLHDQPNLEGGLMDFRLRSKKRCPFRNFVPIHGLCCARHRSEDTLVGFDWMAPDGSLSQ